MKLTVDDATIRREARQTPAHRVKPEPPSARRTPAELDELVCSGDGGLSAQLLSGLFVNATRRTAAPVTAAQALEQLRHYVQIWPVVPITSQVLLESIRGVQEYQLSFRDAQTWAAARSSQVPTVLTEGLIAGAVIEGMRFVDLSRVISGCSRGGRLSSGGWPPSRVICPGC
jgi:predicted nucleic acid-binding protein